MFNSVSVDTRSDQSANDATAHLVSSEGCLKDAAQVHRIM
jgi:hypothetical protein